VSTKSAIRVSAKATASQLTRPRSRDERGAAVATALKGGVSAAPPPSLAPDGGCCTKPSEKTASAVAEVHARADVRGYLAMDGLLARHEMGDFGARP
jgi:hypothetical protein